MTCKRLPAVLAALLVGLGAGNAVATGNQERAAEGKAARKPARAAKAERKPGDPKVDLNRATVEELVGLPGIGRKRAEAIVAQRAKRPFRRTLEIRRIRGVGRKTLQRLLPLITVGPPEKPGK
jgi:competence protein ComEA